MSKITLNNLANLNNATTVTTAINSNNQTLIDAVDNTLSRDGTSPNTMSSVIDMNSNKIINVGGPTGSQDAVRLIDIQNINADAAALAVAVGTAQAFSTSASSSATSASSSATSASTFATAAGSSATAAAISATSASSSLATLLASGIWNNSLQNVISSSYAVANSDFTKTIVCNGGTSGLTLTFGSASGYSSSHVNFVQNNSTSRAVKVSIDSYAGWNGTNHIYLWPQCGGFVFKANGTWCHTFPMRWPLPNQNGVVTFHVDPAGNDANDGLKAGTTNALQTIQEGINRIHCLIDHGNFVPAVQLSDGTHQVGAGVFVNYPIGHTEFIVTGNPSSPTNCIVNCDAGGTCFFVQEPTTITLDGMYFTTSGNGATAISLRQFATCDLGNLVYGNFPLGTHIGATNHSSMGVIAPQRVAGSAVIHLACSNQSFFSDTTFGATVDGGLTFTDFMTASQGSVIELGGAYTGAGSGSGTTAQKYAVASNGILILAGSVVPGNSPGVTSSQGQVF